MFRWALFFVQQIFQNKIQSTLHYFDNTNLKYEF